MSSHFMLGFLHFAVASAMMRSSHKSGSTVLPCDSPGCNMEVSRQNQSDIVCQCCWRDCDFESEDTPPNAFVQQKFTRTALDVAPADAWLIMCHHAQEMLDWNIYTPILETVKVAVESKGAAARIIGTADLGDMLKGIKTAVSAGGRPLVFSVAVQFAADEDSLLQTLKAARDAGAYLVNYQTEPMVSGFRVTNQVGRAITAAEKMGAHEIWDYTLAHTTNYPPINSNLIVRYVPPGYVAKLDAGVDMHSNLTNLGDVGYLGSPGKQMHDKYVSVLAGHLEWNNRVFTNDEVRKFLETYPLQLNQHRFQSCCPRHVEWESAHQHFEAFRMSVLLANKACVISAPSSDEDMRVWKDIVHFAEVEETPSVMKKLAKNLDDCRKHSYETYKREFAPAKLLENSGFFQVWSPMHGN